MGQKPQIIPSLIFGPLGFRINNLSSQWKRLIQDSYFEVLLSIYLWSLAMDGKFGLHVHIFENICGCSMLCSDLLVSALVLVKDLLHSSK